MSHKMDENQFIEAYDSFADDIFRHCYFRLSDKEKAKDTMQETFTKAWQFIIGGNRIDNMRAFLYKIANNLIIDQYRKKKELSLDDMQEVGFDPGFDDRENLENFIAGKQALPVVESLKEPYRSVIIMRYIDDMAVSEIAKVMDVSENLVSVRINRALRQLRGLFERADNQLNHSEK